MQQRNINQKTNSYYTEEEQLFLEENGFNWSNKSNSSYEGYDNCMYKNNNGISYDIEVRKSGFLLSKTEPTLFNDNTTHNSDIAFDEVKEILKRKTSISYKILKINAHFILFLHFVFFILFSPILMPVFYIMNKKEMTIKKYFIRVNKLFNPGQTIHFFALNDLKIRIWIFYFSIFLVSTTLIVNSLLM